MRILKTSTLLAALAALVLSCKGKEPVPAGERVFEILDTEIALYSEVSVGEAHFKSSADWCAYTSDDWVSVITPNGNGGTQTRSLSFSVTENTTGEDRVGLISVSSDSGFGNIVIRQSAASEYSISNFLAKLGSTDFSRVYICAHRANTFRGTYVDGCPENSIPAIRKSIETGMDMVEIDVRETKDGQLICLHDADIRYVTTGSGNVSNLTYQQICSYNMKVRETSTVAKGVHIPLLKDALLACKGKIWVNLDLAKEEIPAGKVVDVIRETGMLDQVTCYVGSDIELAGTYYRLSGQRLSMHIGISKAGEATLLNTFKTKGIYQFNYKNYDGTSGTTALAEAIRKWGNVSFSNLLAYDSDVRGGKLDALDKFTTARIDIMQTDVGDYEKVQNYLKEKNLR